MRAFWAPLAFLLCGCGPQIGEPSDMCAANEPAPESLCDGNVLESAVFSCTGPYYDTALTRTVRVVQDCTALGLKCLAATSGSAVACAGSACMADSDCPTDQQCGADGTCAPTPTCWTPSTSCNLVCTDPAIDTRNCGACGVRCAGMELCSGGACTSPFEARQIVLGVDKACALLSTGGVACWAASPAAGEAWEAGRTPILTGSSSPIAVAGIEQASEVATGASFSCALSVGGEVACWGWGPEGATWSGGKTIAGATAIAVGPSYVCALLADGSASCWDYDDSAQAVSLQVPSFTGATAIAAGRSEMCALFADGTITCWPVDANGAETADAVSITGIRGATAIAASDSYACALLSDATVACWGSLAPAAGALPGATDRSPITPTPLVDADGTKLVGATAIATGTTYACALLRGGAVACWAWASSSGSSGSAAAVANVAGLPSAAAIAAGGDKACAIVSGSIECWAASVAPVVEW